MKPWYARRPWLAWLVVVACSIAGSAGGSVAGDAIYGVGFFTWAFSGRVTGFSLAGSLLGTAAGITIVVVSGGHHGSKPAGGERNAAGD
jgi:hypothetical protein